MNHGLIFSPTPTPLPSMIGKHRKLGDLQCSLVCSRAGDLKSKEDLPGLNSRCERGCLPPGGSLGGFRDLKKRADVLSVTLSSRNHGEAGRSWRTVDSERRLGESEKKLNLGIYVNVLHILECFVKGCRVFLLT